MANSILLCSHIMHFSDSKNSLEWQMEKMCHVQMDSLVVVLNRKMVFIIHKKNLLCIISHFHQDIALPFFYSFFLNSVFRVTEIFLLVFS